MELQDIQSIFLPEKMIDHDAKMFIKSAYNNGISVKLIDRFLKESNYASSTTIVEDELKAIDIFPNNYNCSRNSGIGKRYLTYIIDKFKCNTLEDVAEIAFNEVVTFYDFDNNSFANYWHEFCDFRNQLITRNERGQISYKPENNDWVMYAFTHFGYTLVPLSEYLSKRNNRITPLLLIGIHRDELQRSDRNYIYPGALYPSDTITAEVTNFWKCCRQIGKEFHTICEWTVIFLGRNFTEESIKQIAHID